MPSLLRRLFPAHRHLSVEALGAHAAALSPAQRLDLALRIAAEYDWPLFSRPGRLEAVLQHVPPTPELMDMLVARLVESGERQLMPYPDGAFGLSASDAAWALAERLNVHAEPAIGAAARDKVLAEMPALDRARLLIALSMKPGTRQERQLLLQARDLTLRQMPELSVPQFLALVAGLRSWRAGQSPDGVLQMGQRLGDALALQHPAAGFSRLELPQMLALQQLVAPSGTAQMPVSSAGGAVLRRLYVAQPRLPQLDVFATTLAEGLERLWLAPEADTAAYVHAARHWGSYDMRQRAVLLDRLLGDCAAVTGVPKPGLETDCFDGERAGVIAMASELGRGRSRVTINTAPGNRGLDSFANAVSTVLHEFTHCHQNWDRHNRPGEPLVQLLASNNAHYIQGHRDLDGYRYQPIEREAFATEDIACPRVMKTISALVHGQAPGYRRALAQKVVLEAAGLAAALDVAPLRAAAQAFQRALEKTPQPPEALLREIAEFGASSADVLSPLITELRRSDRGKATALRARHETLALEAQMLAHLTPRPKPASPLRRRLRHVPG